MTAAEYFSVFLIGLAGSGHCVGMCGVFSVAVSANARNAPTLIARQFAYQLGKATAYVFIGALILLAGSFFSAHANSHDTSAAQQTLTTAQNILGYIAGTIMILVGLTYALEIRFPPTLSRWWQGSAACGAMSALWRSPSLFKSVLIGWINGFLPCGLSLTALIYIASFGSVTGVIAGSYIFGLATLPGLLAIAFLGQRISLNARRWMIRVSGVLLIIFGVLTLLRGNPTVHAWMHEHLMFGGNAHSTQSHSSHSHSSEEICR